MERRTKIPKIIGIIATSTILLTGCQTEQKPQLNPTITQPATLHKPTEIQPTPTEIPTEIPPQPPIESTPETPTKTPPETPTEEPKEQRFTPTVELLKQNAENPDFFKEKKPTINSETGETVESKRILVGQYDPAEYKNNKLPEGTHYDFSRNACGTATLLEAYKYFFYNKYGYLPDISLEDIMSKYSNLKYLYENKNYPYYERDKTMFAYPILLILHELNQDKELYTLYNALDLGYDPEKGIGTIDKPEEFAPFSENVKKEVFDKGGSLIILVTKYNTGHFILITSWQDPDNTGNPTVVLLDSYANNGLGEVYVGPLNEYWEKPEMEQAIGIIPNFPNSN